MLDGAHKAALRAVAQGTVTGEHAVAIRNLSVAGLVAPVEGGAWALTQPGYGVLELEGPGGGGGGASGANDAVGDLKTKIRDWFMT
jgi:hypothetical protein